MSGKIVNINRKRSKEKDDDDYEKCALCNKKTHEKKDTNIIKRSCYIPGCGQLCGPCYLDIYGK